MAKTNKWSEDETKVLIELYGENFVSLEKLSKKKPVFESIVEKLKQQGFIRTACQVSKKIANLRTKYKENCPGPTGGEKPTWIHYDALHKILHERPALNSTVAETSEVGFEEDGNLTPNDDLQSNEPTEPEDNSPEVNQDRLPEPTRKKAKPSNEVVKICSETLEFMKEQAMAREVERNELRTMNESLLGVLNRIATSSEVMANAVSTQNIVVHHDGFE